MLGKMIGALVGGKAAEHAKGIGGPTGAALGFIAPMVLRRLSFPAMIALGVGGYAAKKFFDKEEATKPTKPKVAPSAT